MKIESLSDQLIYVPKLATGICDYEGIPFPDQETLDFVGDEGVEYMREKLISIVDFRKEIHGDHELARYGLAAEQHFFDLKNRIAYEIKVATSLWKKDRPFRDYKNQPMSCDFTVRAKEVQSRNLKKLSNIRAFEMVKSGVSAEFHELIWPDAPA